MADVTAEREATGSAMATRGSRDGGDLQTPKGQTTIADPVVTKVAGIAAREVGGVHALGGGVARALGAVTQRLPVGDSTAQGVSVEVGEKEAAVDLTVVIDYGESIPQVTQSARPAIPQVVNFTFYGTDARKAAAIIGQALPVDSAKEG